MKSFMRIGWLLIALGIAGLLAGCASYRSPKTTERANDFEVIETNSKRLLTPEEMTHLRLAVAKYLEKEGAVASGAYYVKVFLAPDKDGLSTEWVVVRFTRDSDLRFSLLGSYAANSYNYRSYASYDYYPYGYDHFGRISFQYYDDPFYGSHYYFPPRHRHNRDRDHDRDKNRDGDHPRRPDCPGDNPVTPGEPPRVTRTRWDSNSPERNNQPAENRFPHRTGTPGRQIERPAERNREAPAISPARSESPRNEPTARNSSNPAREQSFPHRNGTPGRQSEHQAERSEPAPRESSRNSNNYTPPSYSPPPSQPESRDRPSVDQGARSENRPNSHSEPLEN